MYLEHLSSRHYTECFIGVSSLVLTKSLWSIIQYQSVQSLSRVRLFATPWTAARQASLSITNSRSPPKPMSIKSVIPSTHLILCRPLLLLPSIFPSIKVFANESVLHIRWPKYWSFSLNISPSNEHSGLISFRMDCLDLLAVQGTSESSPTPFTFIKRLFSSSFSAIRVVSSACLRLLIFLPAILIPVCASSSPAFLMMCSTYKLNKQGDNIQPWRTPFPIWNQSVVPCPVLTVALFYDQINRKREVK